MAKLADISNFLLPYLEPSDWTNLLLTEKNILSTNAGVYNSLQATIKDFFFGRNSILNSQIRNLIIVNANIHFLQQTINHFTNLKSVTFRYVKPFPLLLTNMVKVEINVNEVAIEKDEQNQKHSSQLEDCLLLNKNV